MDNEVPRKLGWSLFQFLCEFPTPKAISNLYESISNDLPEDIEQTCIDHSLSVSEEIDRSKILYFNYDEGHSGRFSVFGTNGATIDSDYVLDRPSPLSFIQKYLTTGDNSWDNECTIFVNGMRTFSQQGKIPGMMSSERIELYASTLRLRLAHVHTATNLDQPPGKINVNNTHVLKIITKIFRIVGYNQLPLDEDGNIAVPPTILDILQAALSVLGFLDTPIKRTLRQLISEACKETPLTLMVFSRGSAECNAALREVLKSSDDPENCKRKWREGLTVLTIACSATDWPDGPAYVHLSSWDDPTAQIFCNANQSIGSGKDTIFLHNDSPYRGTFDSHNFQGGTLQFLTVMMLYNKVQSIRDLWELGNDPSSMSTHNNLIQKPGLPEFLLQKARSIFGPKSKKVGGGKIKMPKNIDDLVDAMISITNGREYLWEKEKSLKVARPIPTKEEAVEILSQNLDAEVEIERIRAFFDFLSEKDGKN